MATTVSVSEETRRRLMRLKTEEGARSVDELLEQLLLEHRKLRFMDASDAFRRKLADAGLRFEDLVE